MVSFGVLELFDGGGCRSGTKELEYPSTESLPPICYVFLDIKEDEKAFPNGETERMKFLRHFNLPPLLVSEACCEGNGYFGCDATYSDDGKLLACNLWFRALVKLVISEPPGNSSQAKKGDMGKKTKKDSPKYIWYEMTFFTRWEPGSCIMLCIDTPADMLSKLETAFSKDSKWNPLDFADPFAMYVPLMDEIVKLYDKSVWSIRNMVRPIEKEREKDKDYEVDFSMLQEISRHSIHVGEVLTVTMGILEDMRQWRQTLFPAIYSGRKDKQQFNRDKTHTYLSFQTQILKNFKLRQQSNQDRLQAEITLAYNMITQRDSRVMRSDSQVMKTISLLGMVFLPATFTSSIFGMQFFNYTPRDGHQPERWAVSRKFWLFWLVSAVLTAMSMIVWVLWQYHQVIYKYTNRKFWKRFLKELRSPQGHKDVEKDH